MTTCPEFDLLQPHKCPDPRPRHCAPFNFTTRHLRRSTHFPPYGGPDGAKLDRKLIYGRFRPAQVFRFEEGEDSAVRSNLWVRVARWRNLIYIPQENSFTSCAIMPDDGFLMAGTYLGDVKMFNLATGDLESTYHCHESNVYHIQVLTSC
jgi:HIV-1 Vpr-binding protein